jgi:ABC-2 type transport system ATP-binding protein
VRSGYAGYAGQAVSATTGATTTSVLAAGVGMRRRWGLRRVGSAWALRSASFRLDGPVAGAAAFGIAIGGPGSATALVDLLAGLARPAYGELRVLGEDLTTSRGRSAVRGQVGVARRMARPQPAFRVRGLVEHAARLARTPRRVRDPLAAAIVDRLSLTPWADVPMRSAPDIICRRARLAAAAVHQPDLLLIDGLLDDLCPRDTAALADAIRDLGTDMTIVATGRDPGALALACGEILTMTDGILVRP